MTTPPLQKRLLSYTEAGAELGVDRRTIAQWVKAGTLRTVSPNGRHYVPRVALDELIAETDR